MPRALFRIHRKGKLWQSKLVQELEENLREKHSVLYTNQIGRRLEIKESRHCGQGTFVRENATMEKGELLGVYSGEVGDKTGTYSLQHAQIRRPRKPTWVPMVDGEAEVKSKLIVQAANYNHSCGKPTVVFRSFGKGKFKCRLAFAARRLTGGTELVWNYGRYMICQAGAAARKIKGGEKLTKCMCGGGRCPAGSWIFV
jgi:hypothetical protein